MYEIVRRLSPSSVWSRAHAATSHRRTSVAQANTDRLRQIFLVAILLSAPLLSACSTTLSMTYTCDPAGASLYEGNSKLGVCPLTVQYPITQQDRQRGYVLAEGISAVWISGASFSIPYLRADLRNGTNQQFTFERPRGIPGYATDARYALQLQRNAILVQQEKNQAYTNYLKTLSQINRPPPLITPLSPNVHCTSQTLSRTVYTDCY